MTKRLRVFIRENEVGVPSSLIETETWIGRQQTEQSSMYSCESMEISINSSIDSPQ